MNQSPSAANSPYGVIGGISKPQESTPSLSNIGTPIFPAPLEKSGIESPLSKNPTPRRWMASSISFKASGYSPERRVPLTILIRDKRGQLKRETVAYAVGPNRKVAVARANQILAAVNAFIAPILLLIPLRILEVTL